MNIRLAATPQMPFSVEIFGAIFDPTQSNTVAASHVNMEARVAWGESPDMIWLQQTEVCGILI